MAPAPLIEIENDAVVQQEATAQRRARLHPAPAVTRATDRETTSRSKSERPDDPEPGVANDELRAPGPHEIRARLGSCIRETAAVTR
jgi:hypothetical protein